MQFIEVEKKKFAKFCLKSNQFYNVPGKAYPHKSLNIRSCEKSRTLIVCNR